MTPEEAFERLHADLRRYRLDTALKLITRLQVTYWNEERFAQLPRRWQALWPATINAHQLPYIAKALIAAGGNDHKRADLTFDRYVEIAGLYNHAQAVDRTPLPDPSDVELFLTRLSEQQFRYQKWRWPQIGRALLLFDDLAHDPKHASKFNIPAAFERLTGLSVEQFVMIGVAIWGLMSYGTMESFDAASMAHNNPHMLNDVKMASFLARTASDYDGFRRTCADRPPRSRALTFNAFNPLDATPIIKTQLSGYVVPVPELLLDRVTLGIYHDLLAAHHTDFTNVFGDVFEEYVGKLLANAYDETELLAQRAYGRGGNAGDRSTDWIIAEGAVGTLLECKSTRLTLATKESADRDLVRADLAKGVVKALRQLDRVMRDIRAGRAGLEDLQRLEQLVPTVVTLEPYYTGNSATFRQMVTDQLTEAGVAPFKYQLISVDQLERFLPTIKERGFGKLLLDKMADDEDPSQSKAYWSFGTYMAEVAPGTSRPRLPLLEDRSRRLFRAMMPDQDEASIDAIFSDDEADDAPLVRP